MDKSWSMHKRPQQAPKFGCDDRVMIMLILS